MLYGMGSNCTKRKYLYFFDRRLSATHGLFQQGDPTLLNMLPFQEALGASLFINMGDKIPSRENFSQKSRFPFNKKRRYCL